MAKLETKQGKTIEVKDGAEIREAAEFLGVKFCCRDGLCGTCMVEVLEGEENLSELTEQEKKFGFREKGKDRLACQCKINKGEVKIDF